MTDRTMTRRRMISISGSLAAPLVLRGQQPSDTIRVAFVGTGNRGTYLLRTLLKIPGAQVVAVCDIVEERAAKAARLVAEAGGSARVWTDFRKMLDEQKEIDAVVQATPDHTHKDVNIAILEVGKHLYAEKPLALTPEDCFMTVRAAEQARGIFQVGFQLRHDPRRNTAMKFIHGGGIGKVLVCVGLRHGDDLPRQTPWYFDRNKSGDILIDQGIHILDLFTWAIGTHPARALASGGTSLFIDDPPGRSVMDHYFLIFEYPNGQRVNFSHHYFDPPGFTGIRELVFGSEGAVDLPAGAWQPRGKKGLVKLEVPDADKTADYMSLAAFLENIRTNNRKPLNDAHSALRATLQAIMGTRAIYERRIVTWEEVAGAA